MSNVDDVIRERLKKLRNETVGPSTASEPSSSLPPPNKKSSVEEVEFLLQQLSAHTEIEEKTRNEHLDVESQIRRRLDKLKIDGNQLNLPPINAVFVDDPPPPPPSMNDFNSYDDSLHSDSSQDTCVMCEASPTLVCSGCFDDLYCRSCFLDSHDPRENHSSRPIRQKAND